MQAAAAAAGGIRAELAAVVTAHAAEPAAGYGDSDRLRCLMLEVCARACACVRACARVCARACVRRTD